MKIRGWSPNKRRTQATKATSRISYVPATPARSPPSPGTIARAACHADREGGRVTAPVQHHATAGAVHPRWSLALAAHPLRSGARRDTHFPRVANDSRFHHRAQTPGEDLGTLQDPEGNVACKQLLDLVPAWDAADDGQRSRLLSALFESVDAEALPQRGLRLVATPRGAWRQFFQSLVLERETGLEPATSSLEGSSCMSPGWTSQL